MPGLGGQDNLVSRYLTDTPRAPVHAIFEYPGYAPYVIDAVNGYGFFRGYRNVRLFPEYPD
jgi:hypothetical protein